MKNLLPVLFFLIATQSSSAMANAVYSFSFKSIDAGFPGTVEGIIELDFIMYATGSGTGPAARVEITSAPAAIPPSDEGSDLTLWSTQGLNTFTVQSGVIVDYQFGAAEGNPSVITDSAFCLDNGDGFPLGGLYACNPKENFYWDTINTVNDFNGIGSVTFRLISVEPPTPVPGLNWISLLILAALLLMIGMRSKRALGYSRSEQ